MDADLTFGSVPMGVWARTLWVVLCIIVVTLILMPFQLFAQACNLPVKRRIPQIWHRIIAPRLQLKVDIEGQISAKRPLLIISNHQSWLDIVALGQAFPASFIAKAEVRSWPGFSTLARLQRTVFVNRERRGATGSSANEIAARMVDGDAMILFAEGTTSDGNTILPFKTALFGAAQMAERESGVDAVMVQPVLLTYTHIRGSAVTRSDRKRVSWYGDTELVPHILDYIGLGPVTAKITCCEPYLMSADTDRKQLARDCEADVRSAFSRAFS